MGGAFIESFGVLWVPQAEDGLLAYPTHGARPRMGPRVRALGVRWRSPGAAGVRPAVAPVAAAADGPLLPAGSARAGRSRRRGGRHDPHVPQRGQPRADEAGRRRGTV